MAARASWPALLGLIAGGTVQSSSGGAGLAVVILPAAGTDNRLADNLTEVAMARIAGRTSEPLVGTLELERRVRPELFRNPLECAERLECLTRIGLALRVRRLVFGTVQSLGDLARIELALVDLAANQVDERYLADVEARLPAMIGAVGAGMDRLFRIGPLAPLASARLPQVKRLMTAAPVPPARELVLSVVPPRPPQRHRWAAPLAYATAMAAVACLSTGAVFGTLGGIEPNGSTRAEAQDDLQRRKTYGRLGTALIVGGIVLTLGSTATFAGYWRSIVGD